MDMWVYSCYHNKINVYIMNADKSVKGV